MTDLSRDEVIAMAREAAAQYGHTLKDVPETATIEFITALVELARAPLVAENAALKEACNKAAQAELDLLAERNALKTELAAMKAGEPDDSGCWKCGQDGGTSCGAVHCGLLESEPDDQPSAVKVVREMVEALEAVEALIEHQYTGTRDGMNALQNAADDAHDALKIGQKFLKESGE